MLPCAIRRRSASGVTIDDLDLFGATNDGVRNGLLLVDAGDLLHHVVDRLQVLDVHGGDYINARVQQRVDVLPPLLVRTARHVRVRELVYQRHGWVSGQHGIEVHLFQQRAAIFVRGAWNHLEVPQLGLGERSTVGLHVRNDDVGAAFSPTPAFVEHAIGLADAGRRTQIDPQDPSLH